jgi:hypothetical protein
MAVLLPSVFGGMPTPVGAPVLADICSAAHPLAATPGAQGYGSPLRRESPRGVHCPLCVPVAQALAFSSAPELIRVPPDVVTYATECARVPEVRSIAVQAARPRGPPAFS